MLMQGLCYMCKPFDELLIVPYQAQEGLDFHVRSGQSKLSHSFQVLFVGPYTLFGDMMSQVVNLIPEELTLRGF